MHGEAIFPDAGGGRRFRSPTAVLCAMRVAEVRPALEQAAEAVARGAWAAGFVAYEAAPAFDAALDAHPPGALPLLWLGLYDAPEPLDAAPGAARDFEVGAWAPACSEAAYRAALAAIRSHLAAGDTYQVNYTFPLHAAFRGDARAWFDALCVHPHGRHRAFIDTGRHQLLSLSPERFFALDGDRIAARPMKGTRRRGRWVAEDFAARDALASSEKDRAENVMIVDMLRNDLGRIAERGSIEVAERFAIERYPTVWQMTSAVTARTRAGVPEIFAALFPCASVTGAPKVQTMRIIRALEPQARGAYCGAIGWWGPGRQAEFNVAIRTVAVDGEAGTAVYHVGSGVVWDSSEAAEYRECLDKAALLTRPWPAFDLLETLRWDDAGFTLLEAHLARMARSANRFDYYYDPAAARAALDDAVRGAKGPQRVRLTMSRAGAAHAEPAPLPPPRPWRVGLAAEPVDPEDLFLHHKTTHRAVYDRARAARPDCDDVLLWNTRGELTESTFANVVLDLDGRAVTPPREAGLLPGTRCANEIALGEIAVARLTRGDLARAARIRLINSVRGWIDVDWQG